LQNLIQSLSWLSTAQVSIYYLSVFLAPVVIGPYKFLKFLALKVDFDHVIQEILEIADL
jgi:hypothetical protein